jgi:hypothetical protein
VSRPELLGRARDIIQRQLKKEFLAGFPASQQVDNGRIYAVLFLIA